MNPNSLRSNSGFKIRLSYAEFLYEINSMPKEVSVLWLGHGTKFRASSRAGKVELVEGSNKSV